MRVVFFGTPGFAVPSLRALLAGGHEVAAVVTQPDKPHGRSRSTLLPPPVKDTALETGLAVLQPERPAGEVFAAWLKRLDAEIGVVVAYGHILRPDILVIPRRGMINVHASLLPRLRGAAPIQWAILNGDTATGVSIMQMEAGLDSGPVLHRAGTAIEADETAGELADRLARMGARALLETLVALGKDQVRPEPQDDTQATHAPKITRELARLDWSQNAVALVRRIRAFDPAPGAWTTLGGQEVKLFGALVAARTDPSGTPVPGEVLAAGERIRIATGDGAIDVREVLPAGKGRMAAADWVRGRGIALGHRFQ